MSTNLHVSMPRSSRERTKLLSNEEPDPTFPCEVNERVEHGVEKYEEPDRVVVERQIVSVSKLQVYQIPCYVHAVQHAEYH